MPFVQNISEEVQLLRVQGTKQVVKPGEIAEITDTELKTAKGYRRLFAHVDEAGEVILTDAEKRSAESEEDRKAKIKKNAEAKKAAKKAEKAPKKEKDVEPPKEEDKDTETDTDTEETDEKDETEENSTSQDAQGDEQK
jgi:hypothetical protein